MGTTNWANWDSTEWTRRVKKQFLLLPISDYLSVVSADPVVLAVGIQLLNERIIII